MDLQLQLNSDPLCHQDSNCGEKKNILEGTSTCKHFRAPHAQCTLCGLRRGGKDQWTEGRLSTYRWHVLRGHREQLGNGER